MAFADVGAGGFNAKPIGTMPGAAPQPASQGSTSTAAPQPVLEPGMAGYAGPSASQANAIQGFYQAGTPYADAVKYGMSGQAAPQPQLPDFNTLLQKQLENLGFSQLDNGLRQQQEQLLIRFGDPSLAAMAGFGVDPQAADFARQNYLSGNADLARLDKQSQLAKQQIINRLAGHGILFSGDTGYQLGQQDQNYGNQRYDLTNKYLDALNQLTQSVQQQKNQMRQNLVNSLLNFYSQYAANPQQLAGIFG